MADEPVTDATNSVSQETPMDAPEQTNTNTSTTEETTPTSDDQPAASDETAAEAGADDLDDTLISATEGEETAVELHGAPEGDYELELPEGTVLDADALATITPLAKELNLSNAGLSKLANEALPVAGQMFERAMVQDVVATRKGWADDARAYVQGGTLTDGTAVEASPIFAGETMDAVTKTAARALDALTTDANGQPLMFPAAKADGSPGTFNDFLKTTGLGLHPAMIHFAFRAGKAISEDSFERSGDTPQTKLSREEKYYPSQAT